MSSRTLRARDDPPPSIEERYAAACTTSDLGLPIGDGAGAQGILAAAAWTEVHLGSDLRRLRNEWEAKRPNPRVIAAAQLTDSGPRSTRRQVKKLAVAHALHGLGVQQLTGWRPALEKLTVYAAKVGIEYPDTEAYAVLRRWLEAPQRPPEDAAKHLLWVYLQDCLKNASKALPQGLRGRTNHHPD